MSAGIKTGFEMATSLFSAKTAFSIINIFNLYSPLIIMIGIVAILHHSVASIRIVRFKSNAKKYTDFYKVGVGIFLLLLLLLFLFGYSADRRHSDSCYSQFRCSRYFDVEGRK